MGFEPDASRLPDERPYVLLDRNILCNCDIEAESNFLLKSLAACEEHKKPDLEMYFMANLAFVDYLEQLNETITTPINRNWTSVKQPIPFSLDSFQVSSKLMHVPIILKDFMEQYQDNRVTVTRWEDLKSKFRTFINSFLVDMLIFIAAILAVFLVLVILYVITGQSKLKALITTMALQRIRAMELYISLDLNQLAGNTHLFKLTGELSLENVTLKKYWIWDVLEIKWENICIVLNDKEVHLPTMLLIPFIHKLKVRKLFGKRNLMHVYIMLKQRKSWYNLESEWE